MSLEVRYSIIAGRRGPVETGSGRTIDMSSSGLSFTADTPLSIGQTLDMSIDWPVRLAGDVQIQLVASAPRPRPHAPPPGVSAARGARSTITFPRAP